MFAFGRVKLHAADGASLRRGQRGSTSSRHLSSDRRRRPTTCSGDCSVRPCQPTRSSCRPERSRDRRTCCPAGCRRSASRTCRDSSSSTHRPTPRPRRSSPDLSDRPRCHGRDRRSPRVRSSGSAGNQTAIARTQSSERGAMAPRTRVMVTKSVSSGSRCAQHNVGGVWVANVAMRRDQAIGEAGWSLNPS